MRKHLRKRLGREPTEAEVARKLPVLVCKDMYGARGEGNDVEGAASTPATTTE